MAEWRTAAAGISLKHNHRGGKMSKDYKSMTKDELVYCICWDSQKAGALKELRKLYPQQGTKKVDPGHFYVCNYGSLEGFWGFAKDNKTTRAKLQGEKWEEFKRNHPDWEKEGKE